jgi:hypothetical protein
VVRGSREIKDCSTTILRRRLDFSRFELFFFYYFDDTLQRQAAFLVSTVYGWDAFMLDTTQFDSEAM